MRDQAATELRRIAINVGGGYVPGLNAVAAGAVMAARKLDLEVVAIRDGYEGALFRNHYSDGGIAALDVGMIDGLMDIVHVGTSRLNPFSVRTDTDGFIEERDRSDDVLATLKSEGIDAVISVAGRQPMSIVWKLACKGLRSICVPVSVENDMAATNLAFGYISTLDSAIELLVRIRRAALVERRIAVVEVLGHHSGFLALQAGIAALADAILLPEIRYAPAKVAQHLTADRGRPALLVVAEGARPLVDGTAPDNGLESTRRALSPGSSAEDTAGGRRVIERSGAASSAVADCLQRTIRMECSPLVLDQLLRANQLSAVDRQIGLAYGAAAVRGLIEGYSGTMVAFKPPHIEYVRMAEAISAIRTVPPDSDLVVTARSLGISLGD
ncbi:hypothetical protein A5662_06140 [Mycobacteriaceae bacterium 1482268.1]|nr:hypothetical protein A5662_06140 [Mycobacteriaceae bacterium 1482268.1]